MPSVSKILIKRTAILISLLATLTACGPHLEPVVTSSCKPPPSLLQPPPATATSLQQQYQEWLEATQNSMQ